MEPETQNRRNLLNYQLNPIEETQNNETSYTEDQLIENSNNQVLLNPQKLKFKSSLLLGRYNNTLVEEKDFRKICRLYKKHKNPSVKLKKAYQEYIKTYNWLTSLYLPYEIDDEAALIIYNTKNEREVIKRLKTYKSIDKYTCVAQLPNGELFCYGSFLISGITIIIDSNYKIHTLPSGKPTFLSSAIYFNKNVYCFGGYANSVLKLSRRFDLDRTRWIELTPLPEADERCHSIIFNGNILISGCINRNLLIYSVNIDSFSVINYNFERHVRKILTNAEDRIYLIECNNGSIYESELGNEYIWELIGKSPISVI